MRVRVSPSAHINYFCMKSKFLLLIPITVIIFVILYFAASRDSVGSNKNVIENNQQLSLSVNQQVTLKGQAVDAKTGAVLLIGSIPVYIENWQAWPESLGGIQVIVSGKLVLKSYLPETEVQNGEVSQGGSGEESYVLEDVKIK